MTYDRFEDTPVWQAAADLAAAIFDWVEHPLFRDKGDLADQLQRAALSISNNIAEGFERGTTNELLQFLYYARGSAGEVRSMLGVMERTARFHELKSPISKFKSQCESISRQIRGWANSLQNSDISGQRHLNDQSRRAYENRQRHEEYQKRMDTFNKELLARLESQRQARLPGASPTDPRDGDTAHGAESSSRDSP
jgi:four helix bundle protein